MTISVYWYSSNYLRLPHSLNCCFNRRQMWIKENKSSFFRIVRAHMKLYYLGIFGEHFIFKHSFVGYVCRWRTAVYTNVDISFTIVNSLLFWPNLFINLGKYSYWTLQINHSLDWYLFYMVILSYLEYFSVL